MNCTAARLILAVVAAGTLVVGCSRAVPGRMVAPSAQASGPQIAAPGLAPLLLTDEQLRTVMASPAMATYKTYGELEDDRSVNFTMGDPVCVTAMWNAITQSYRGSGDQAVAGRQISEPGEHPDHDVDEAVVLFKTADQAQRHLDQSMVTWQRCAGKRQRYQIEGRRIETWSVGIPADVGPDIVVRNSKEGGDGYVCQRVMRAVGNVVIDAWACGRDITDQGRVIVDDIAAQVHQ